MDTEVLKAITGLGQAAIFAWAAYQFYRDGRAQDKVFINHLQEQNKMLLAAIMQQTFLRSSAINPAPPPVWNSSTPTDILP
jgi:hypothetical protein